MSATRITRSKAKVTDNNENCNSVSDKNKQIVNLKEFKLALGINDPTPLNSDKGQLKTKTSEMDPAPIKLKNTFNNFNNVQNISETTNRTVSTREATSETENTQMQKSKELSASKRKLLFTVDKMVMSSKIDLKVVRSLLEHVSGGDVAGLLSKIVTSSELDKLVDIVGATEVKNETIDDNEEVEAVEISDGESDIANKNDNLGSEKDLPVISHVVGAQAQQSSDEVEVTRVIEPIPSSFLSGLSPLYGVPSFPPIVIEPSSSSSSSIPSFPSSSSNTPSSTQQFPNDPIPSSSSSIPSFPSSPIPSSSRDEEYRKLSQRYLLDAAQLENQMQLQQFLQNNGRIDSSNDASISSSSRGLSSATLTPMGVSLMPVSSTSFRQTLPVHGYMEPASITPLGVSLTKIVATHDGSSSQIYADPRSDLKICSDPRSDLPSATRITACRPGIYSDPRSDLPSAYRPPVIMSVESLSKSASVVAHSLNKSSARRFRSSGCTAAVLTKVTDAGVEPIDDDVVVVPAPQKRKGKKTKLRSPIPTSSEDEGVSSGKNEEIQSSKRKGARVKRTRPKRLNNIIEDSESESLEESESDEESLPKSDEEFVYEEATNENMQRNRKLITRSSKKRKNSGQSTDSSESGRKFLRSRNANSSEDEDSYSSDDMTEKAKRSRAFKQFKQQRSSVKKSSEKRKARISARPVESETDDEEKKEQNQKMKKAKRNIFNSPKKRSKVTVAHNYIYSDSSESENNRDLPGFIVDNIESSESDDDPDDLDSDDEDFVINEDEDDNANYVDDDFRKMMDSLKRRSEKFQNLNDDYENETKCRQLGGYDDSDNESSENKYPPKLLDDLREVRDEARKDDDQLEAAEELSNDDLIREWEMYQLDESADHDGECVCGKTGLRWMYFMRNKKIQNWEFYTRIVGSECINWFNKANPNSSMAVLSKVAKDGCILYYRKKLSSGLLLMTLGGNILPGFLAENQENHKEEYSLPITVTKLKCGTNRVDVKIKPPPGSQGKGFEKVRDSNGKPLSVDQRYHAYLKPVIKPTKPIKPSNRFSKPSEDKKEPAKVEFVLIRIENLSQKQAEAAKKVKGHTNVKSFIK